ncbi:MAG: S41 family peptidase [Candidatus Gastranaerophilales bacterium]|nr:S41 family peptidase [Candidatus Gastranaerophilales bacterium]
MKLHKHVKKQYLFLIITLLFLFFVKENSYYTENKSYIESETNAKDSLSPVELFNSSYKLIKNNYWDKEIAQNTLSRLKKHYQGKIKDDADAKVAINSMLQGLNDPYSKFLDKEEFEEQNTSINSKIYGIGINIASQAGKIVIINVIKGTPADLAGLKSGDLIIKINGNDAPGKSIFQIANYIKNPKLQTVNIEVLRGNKKIIKQIKKDEIKIKTVYSEIIDKEIGYIKITSFITNECPIEFIDAINKIKDTKALVLDLRGNTGGLFQNAIFVVDLFLKDKNIVSVQGRSGHKNLYKTHDSGYIYDKPMAVLVDGESASASEIVSGALKDNKRAFIIGTRTFGKGLVQKVFPMANGTGMNLTIARYLTPLDIDINKKGIEPDFVIQITQKDRISNTDSQLNFALKTLHAEIERSKLVKK